MVTIILDKPRYKVYPSYIGGLYEKYSDNRSKKNSFGDTFTSGFIRYIARFLRWL